MKKFLTAIAILLLTSSFSFADDDTEHGIYLQLVKNIKGTFEETASAVANALEKSGFNILEQRNVATPDIVRENSEDICGYNGKLILFTNDDYIKMLTSFGNKYLVASFLRLGINETDQGIQIIIADPETINRIIFNDLNDEDYQLAVNKTIPFKDKIINAVHSASTGENVTEVCEPKRTEEDLREAARDMFMMVGPMTFFDDEDQFPVIYQEEDIQDAARLDALKNEMYKNIKSFQPNLDDKDYRWTKNPDEDLKWKVLGEVYSPDKKAVLFGVTRNRTEAVSFYIVGDETENNKCPGLDHLTAYPIEVLLLQDEEGIKVYSCREMFRMDMYFWDAGMGAFMNHMGMPGMLDESIYRALFAKDKD